MIIETERLILRPFVESGALKYEKIGDYKVKDYAERPHEYKK